MEVRPKRATLKRLLTDRSFCGSQDFSKKLIKKARVEVCVCFQIFLLTPPDPKAPNYSGHCAVYVKPGKKQKGVFELIEREGKLFFEFHSEAADSVKIVLDASDIKHCMFYRNQGDSFTVIQFLTNTLIDFGSKSSDVFQVIHEGGRKTRNPREINLIFKSFIHSFKDRVKFTIDIKPHRKLGFQATVHDEQIKVPSHIFLQATPSAIVGISLDNQPDFYIFLSDVIVVFLERVKAVQSFDITVMTRGKNDTLHAHHINQVPKKGFEFIKEWLESVNCLVFESPLSISWDIAVAEIRSSKRQLETISWESYLETKTERLEKKEVASVLEGLSEKKEGGFAKPDMTRAKTKSLFDSDSSDSSFCCDELGEYVEGNSSDSMEEEDDDASSILTSLGTSK